MSNAPYHELDELASAIRAARRAADLSQASLAEQLGLSGKTVIRWEAGEEKSLGETRQKRFAVAAQVAAVTQDFSLIGLPAQPEDDRLADLESKVDHLSSALQRLATQALDADEEAEFERYLTTDQLTAKPETGGAN